MTFSGKCVQHESKVLFQVFRRTSMFWRITRDFHHPRYQNLSHRFQCVRRIFGRWKKALQPWLVTKQVPPNSVKEEAKYERDFVKSAVQIRFFFRLFRRNRPQNLIQPWVVKLVSNDFSVNWRNMISSVDFSCLWRYSGVPGVGNMSLKSRRRIDGLLLKWKLRYDSADGQRWLLAPEYSVLFWCLWK